MSQSGGTKIELRKRFLAERRALSVLELKKRSQQIADRFYNGGLPERFQPDLPPLSVTNRTLLCHTFLPIERNNEVDTWPLIQWLWQAKPSIRVAVSRTDTRTNQLAHYLFTPGMPLVENSWGIPEPVGNMQPTISSGEIDIVLVPLLAFDQTGHRVGYGGGYYDYFLAECRPDCLKIGLSIFEPIDRIVDVEPTDVRLDACVTPEHTYFF